MPRVPLKRGFSKKVDVFLLNGVPCLKTRARRCPMPHWRTYMNRLGVISRFGHVRSKAEQMLLPLLWQDYSGAFFSMSVFGGPPNRRQATALVSWP